MNYAQFKEQVILSLTDRKPTDDQFIQALSYWVHAHYARDVLEDISGFGNYKGSYDSLRVKLVGYTPTLTLPDLKNTNKRVYLGRRERDSVCVSHF